MATETFDAHASGYDDVAESALGVELRRRVHAVLTNRLEPADSVADLGCGSGLDAAWLAPQVQRVQAFDLSAEMVDLASHRCRAFAHVSVHQGDVSQLDLTEPVNVVLANFGVINCVGDLATFGGQLRSLLVPGGEAVLVSMARWCPIELGIAAVTANKTLMARRSPGTTTGEYAGLTLRYASARDLANEFGGTLELVHAESLGLLLPPFEQRHWVQHRPRLRSALAGADQRFGRLGARLRLGDHHIAVFRRPR